MPAFPKPAKKAKKKKKKKTQSKLKKEAWSHFSQYIRLKYADGSGYAKCVTCGDNRHWKELQAGHFVPGRTNAILFEESGVHPQCRRCNYNEGNGPEYFVFMEKTFGREEIDRLRRLRHTERKFSADELQDMIEDYKAKVRTLLEERAA